MRKQKRLRIHLRNPDKALPTPEQVRINIPSGSGGALQIGVKTDVRTKFYFIGLEETPFDGQKFTAVDLGGTYVGSKNVKGFTYNPENYTVEIDDTYVVGSGAIGMLLPPEYNNVFPPSENSWVVGKMA